MTQSPFSRAALTSALEAAGRSPWFSDQPTRPWLRILGVIGLATVFSVIALIAVGAVLALAQPDLMESLSTLDLSAGIAEGPQRLSGEVTFLWILAVSLALPALMTLAAAMIVYQKPPSALLWPRRKPSLALFGIGFLVMAGALIVLWPILFFIAPDATTGPLTNSAYSLDSRIVYALTAVAALLLAAAAEEIFFRGVILKATASLTRRVWLVCLINGVLFSAIHLDPDPIAFIVRAMLGIIWVWAALRLGGIEFAIGAHLANNLFIALLVEPMSSAAIPGQAMSTTSLGLEIVICVVMLVFVERLARSRRRTDTS